ncbi:LOW QUALITY PROTEIN: uncharacterized protein WCC33_006191 [Rhinophrynus dorsalis]
MYTFMSKSGRDPRKGLERGLKLTQDKLLDITGPIAQILADTALSTGTKLDPRAIREWAQRAICLLGNSNVAISSERRKAALLRIDPKLADLSDKELGPSANGMLFGEPFLKQLQKHVNIFSSLNKAQQSLKKVFRPTSQRGVFGRAGRQRGHVSSRFWPSGPRSYVSQDFFKQPTNRIPLQNQRGTSGVRGFHSRGRSRYTSGEFNCYKHFYPSVFSRQSPFFLAELDSDFIRRMDSADSPRFQNRLRLNSPSNLLAKSCPFFIPSTVSIIENSLFSGTRELFRGLQTQMDFSATFSWFTKNWEISDP